MYENQIPLSQEDFHNFNTPPELIEAFVQGLKKIVENHPDTRKDWFNVYFNNLSAYSQDIMFYIFSRSQPGRKN